MQQRRKSIANALELRLSCANPFIYDLVITDTGYGLSSFCHQAITWNNTDLLSIGPLGKI